jgi:hypothetical protein
MPLQLSADKAWIFRISHIDNLEWILRNGLCCRSSGHFDPNYRNIGNLELINKRASRDVPIPPGGTLDDYVPFYFTSRSPMLLNIKTGKGVPAVPMEEILILVTSLPTLAEKGVRFVFTDRHAYLKIAHFSSDLSELATRIDWTILQNSDFKYDAQDMGKMERYQAEALVYKTLPFDHIVGVLAYDDEQMARIRSLIESAGYSTPVKVNRRFFF